MELVEVCTRGLCSVMLKELERIDVNARIQARNEFWEIGRER
jgi:hypothetical protein